METFNTTSGFPQLNGYMVLDGNDVESYHSNTLGDATNIQNTGGPFLQFVVQWNNVNPVQTYQVNAGPQANGSWLGNANNGQNGQDLKDIEETWAATSQTATAASGKS